MVDTQVRPADVTKFPVIDALLSVPREAYVPHDRVEAAYIGENISLGDHRVLLEPRSFAKLLDALDVQPGDLVLDLGCGLGYSAAVLACLCQTVVGVEADEAMAREAQATLADHGADNAVVECAALDEGAPQHGPYDVIVVEGAAQAVPDAILDQLRDGGRIGCFFREGDLGLCKIGHKSNGQINWRFAFNATAPVLPGFEAAAGFSF